MLINFNFLDELLENEKLQVRNSQEYIEMMNSFNGPSGIDEIRQFKQWKELKSTADSIVNNIKIKAFGLLLLPTKC